MCTSALLGSAALITAINALDAATSQIVRYSSSGGVMRTRPSNGKTEMVASISTSTGAGSANTIALEANVSQTSPNARRWTSVRRVSMPLDR